MLTLSLRLHGGGDGLRTDVVPPSAIEELSDSVLGVGLGPRVVWGLGDFSWRGEGGGLCEGAAAFSGVGFGLASWSCSSTSSACRNLRLSSWEDTLKVGRLLVASSTSTFYEGGT